MLSLSAICLLESPFAIRCRISFSFGVIMWVSFLWLCPLDILPERQAVAEILQALIASISQSHPRAYQNFYLRPKGYLAAYAGQIKHDRYGTCPTGSFRRRSRIVLRIREIQKGIR